MPKPRAAAVAYGVGRTQYQVLVIAEGGAVKECYTSNLEPSWSRKQARAAALKTATEMAIEEGVPSDRVEYNEDIAE